MAEEPENEARAVALYEQVLARDPAFAAGTRARSRIRQGALPGVGSSVVRDDDLGGLPAGGSSESSSAIVPLQQGVASVSGRRRS